MEPSTVEKNSQDTRQKPEDSGSIVDIREFALARNREQSAKFTNPAAKSARQLYRVQHPTEFMALKCMDGRLNLSVMTETPVGIIRPYRNIGGKFDLGWPLLGELVRDWFDYSISKGRHCVLFATYHFSKGEKHRGCAGLKYDTDAARNAAGALVIQAARVFGTPYTALHPMLVGIETDEDALVFHNEEGETFSVADNLDMDENELQAEFGMLYPMLSQQTRCDLLELVKGNQRHIQELRNMHRQPIDLDHREQIIGVGRGFDWLHLPNKALIVGPYSPDWPQEGVVTAGRIVLGNFEKGQLSPDAGTLLLVSSLSRYSKDSTGWNFALEKACHMRQKALETLTKEVPDLVNRPGFSVVMGVVDENTRLLHVYE